MFLEDIQWNQIRKRFEALWQNDLVDRCCVRVTAWNDGQPEPKPFPVTLEERKSYWLDGEQVLERELDRFKNTYFAGDAFPQIFSNFGAAGHAAYFKGAAVDYQESIWIGPRGTPPVMGDDFKVEPDYDSLLFKKTFEVCQYLASESAERYFVSMPDISGNLDALAHLRGSDILLGDMLMQPGCVHYALDEIQKIWEHTVLNLFPVLSEVNDGGSTVGWLDTWAPGLHAQLQSDISVMVSSEIFNEFSLPELEKQSEILEYPLYHLDGLEQVRHLDQLLSIEKLKMIQWTNVAGQPSPVTFIPVFRQIQEAGKALLIRLNSLNEIEPIMQALSSRGLYLYVEPVLESPQAADAVVRTVEKLSKD